MITNLINGLPVVEPFLVLAQRTWGIIGVGAVLGVVIVSIIFYLLGARSERH